MDLEERLCVLLLKLFPHNLLLSHAYETNSNRGIEEECEKGMHWFRLLNTTAFIQKDYLWLHRLLPCSWGLHAYEHWRAKVLDIGFFNGHLVLSHVLVLDHWRQHVSDSMCDVITVQSMYTWSVSHSCIPGLSRFRAWDAKLSSSLKEEEILSDLDIFLFCERVYK